MAGLDAEDGGQRSDHGVVAADGQGDTPLRAALSLVLRDPASGQSASVRSRVLGVEIDGDLGAQRWCLTAAMRSPPLAGSAPCEGGAGPLAGWWETRPSTFALPQLEGVHQVTLWVADEAGRVSSASALATVVLDTTPPATPTLALAGVDTGSALLTATGAVELVLGAASDTTAWCVREGSVADATPDAPAPDDPCFVSPPPTRYQLRTPGGRLVWVFARDAAWNVAPTPGSARITWSLGAGTLAPFIWIGRAGDGAFSNPANWSTGVVPREGEVARFDAHCGARCDSTIDTPVSLLGLELGAGYSGTLTQGAGRALTLGASGLVIGGGTLRGSDSPIDVNGNVTLSGGRLESTSATLSIGLTTDTNNSGGLTVTGGQFVAGTGTVAFDGAKGGGVMTDVARIDAVSPLQLHRLELNLRDPDAPNGSDGAMLRLGDDTRVVVQAELILHDGKLVGGGIELRGQLTTTCTANGVCAEGGITPVLINGTGVQTYGGFGTAPLVVVDKTGSFEPTPGTTSYAFSGLKLVRGSFVTPTGTLRFHFDREYGLPAPHADEGFRLLGGTFVNRLSELAIEMAVGTDSTFNALPIDVGTLDLPALRVDLDDYNLRRGMNGDLIGLAPTTILRVAGALTVLDGKLDGGRIEVGGNVAFYCWDERNCAGGGTTQLVLTGVAPQTLYQKLSSMAPVGNYSAALPGATLLIDRPPSAPPVRATSPLQLGASGSASQGLRLVSGALTTEGRALTVGGTLTLEQGSTLSMVGGALSYGALVNNGGTLQF